MKISELQVGDKLHVVDDLYGSHKKIQIIEILENAVKALNYRNKEVTIECDDLTNYKKEA
ncbi:MAG: hypothetical protein VXY34_07195 [Bdellovibrionota bacterium]|jgi:hypothetical protein|nr:hypothetical protein [Bdellovibrionota bacterium]|tara:strand:+ start:1867 stop:2046 length:180 start_codon:yes stop_codon:yes gene_type:complete